MERYILTGAPRAGKTAILHQLELDGYGVVEEAATDIIALEQAQAVAEPWLRASFIDVIVNLQLDRQLRAARFMDDFRLSELSGTFPRNRAYRARTNLLEGSIFH